MATATDRAAIAAIARELTDDDWSDMDQLTGAEAEPGDTYAFDGGRTLDVATARLLLSYLDGIWDGLVEPHRERMLGWGSGHCVIGALYTDTAAAVLESLGILVDAGDWMGGIRYHVSPFGRAVLKRAKETGR